MLKTIKSLALVAAFGLAFFAADRNSSNAATMIQGCSGSDLFACAASGITDLEIGGMLYDVEFHYGSYTALNPPGYSPAADVVNAINTAFNNITLASMGVAIVTAPGWSSTGYTVFTGAVGCGGGSCAASVLSTVNPWTSSLVFSSNLDFDQSAMWAYVTEATGAVPLPAALPLLAGGLGLMGFMGRRRKPKAAA